MPDEHVDNVSLHVYTHIGTAFHLAATIKKVFSSKYVPEAHSLDH